MVKQRTDKPIDMYVYSRKLIYKFYVPSTTVHSMFQRNSICDVIKTTYFNLFKCSKELIDTLMQRLITTLY